MSTLPLLTRIQLLAPILLCLTSMTGCYATATPRAHCSSSTANDDKMQLVAKVNGQEIGAKQILQVAEPQITQMVSNQRQELFRLKLYALKQAIENELFAQEAKKQNISVKELLEKEVEQHIEEPSDEIIEAYYNTHASQLQLPLEMLADRIKSHLMEIEQDKARMDFLERLMEDYTVKYSLVPPSLPKEEIPLPDKKSWFAEKIPVVIVEFSDYQCPYCARTSKLIHEVSDAYGEKVARVFKHFPLPSHQRAKAASRASVCAQKQGKFWQFHQLLFENQQALAEEDLMIYAQKIGLDVEAFGNCYMNEEASKEVEKDRQAGMKLNIEGTPTIFINGQRLVGYQPREILEAYIEKELAQ